MSYTEAEAEKKKLYREYQQKMYPTTTKITTSLYDKPVWKDAFTLLLIFAVVGSGVLGYMLATLTVMAK